ncbi:hypothetical protein [Halorussus sp. MSC15.2]|uniref:hypothetical protein n=1 Tax=Halorussus sp. MSC15.2 TaxID=2283638 RepID=UPI0013D7196B|nr:hypothetical protein [Halorussus sp. MSC15.2]NEU56872.1 hypothetical protein [Halorussus sp. MSC15.2]
MQKRTTTLYVAFFLLVATAAFTVLSVTAQPTASIENPDYTVTEGDQFSVDGQTYNVTDVSARISKGELVRSATAKWVNASARYTETWANNSTISYQNNSYRVLIPNQSKPSAVTLREIQQLGNDTTTVEQEGQTFVITNGSDGNRTLVPIKEYKRQQFGEPETKRLTTGGTIQYKDNSTSVTNITRDSVKIVWTAPRTNTVKFGETTAVKTTLIRGGVPTEMQFPAGGNNVTLNGKTYTSHYPNNSTLVLSDQPSKYQSALNAVNHRNERIAGIWGVLILSMLATILLTGLAFLPNK